MILLELERIRKKRVFMIMIAVSIVLQIFALWYSDSYIEGNVPLASHKALNQHLSKLSESEKGSYFLEEKELMEAMLFEEKSLMYLNEDNELGQKYVEHVLKNKTDYYNKYLQTYTSGSYLKYTDNLESESNLIEKNLENYNKVNGYGEYIDKISNSSLGTISIFKTPKQSSFSEKNIEKSGKDHEGFDNIKLKYFDTYGITETFKFSAADMFIILLTVYFAIQLIWEEKETGLHSVTRATKNGRLKSIIGKLGALFLHALSISITLFIIRFLWFGINAGFIDMNLPIQSAAEYMESCMHFNFIQMAFGVMFLKVLGAYTVGLFVLSASQRAKSIWVPWLVMGMWTTINGVFYFAIDINSKYAFIKAMSFFNLFNGDKMIGQYLNVNLMGTPISAAAVSITFSVVLLLVLLAINTINYVFFYQGEISARKNRTAGLRIMDKTVTGHEFYKLMIMNKGIAVLLLFCIVAGGFQYATQYKVSSGETYYQEIMTRLEGEPDDNKEEIIIKEQEKYDDARNQIEKIDQLLADGAVSDLKADEMKIRYEIILSFYPQFEKVLLHYERATSDGTEYLYDTGYREAFWMNGNINNLLCDLLIASIAIILIFGSTFSMEQEGQSWILIGTTYTGPWKIKRKKTTIAMLVTTVMAAYSIFFRLAMIDRSYPINNMLFSARTVLGYDGMDVPLLLLIIGILLLHIGIYCAITSFVLWISSVREKTNEVYFFSSVLVIVPLCLLLIIW